MSLQITSPRTGKRKNGDGSDKEVTTGGRSLGNVMPYEVKLKSHEGDETIGKGEHASPNQVSAH